MRTVLLILPLAVGLALPAAATAVDRISIDKVNGSIHAESGRAYARLETVNGAIEIDARVLTGAAETVNGAITVGDGAQVGELTTVNGAIHAGTGVRVDGGVSAVNGGILFKSGSRIGGGVETVNGAIGLVGTDVARGLRTVNGDVTVGVGSHVRGGLTVEKPQMQLLTLRRRDPRIVIGPDAQVDGELVFERPVILFVHDSARIGATRGATARRYGGAAPPAE